MSDDLKERLGSWRDYEPARAFGRPILRDVADAKARIEQLEALVDTLQTAMTAPTQDEIDLRSKLASSQAEALAAHAEVIRTQDEIGRLLHHAEAQLAAESVREVDYCTFGPSGESKRQWLMIFEDADRGICIYDNEAEAHEAWDRAKDSWTCTLYETCERKFFWAAGQLRALATAPATNGEKT